MNANQIFSMLAAAGALGVTVVALGADRATGTTPRFDRPLNPIALAGPARPARYMEASGRRAAFLGREDGRFEAWVYPLKIFHDFNLAFGTEDYAEAVPAANLAATVDIRPETSTVRYAHAAFTADATWLVPADAPGGLVLLDIDTSKPLTIVARLRVDLKPMWPAALGGQYSYWDDELKALVIGEASGKHGALVGSPLALKPPEQPAHNLPDAPSQFTIAVSPEAARGGLVPIVVAASVDGLEQAKKTYRDLLTRAGEHHEATVAHYRRLREELTSIDTPDDRVDLAFEWGKVALDKGFVCNPQLGCGLVAGLGPSGTTERPGFGWFFGGDTFINSWAMTAYGDFETVRASLEFLQKHQRADGKMPHEISQGAAYVRWFEEFPYAYYHADTTPLYISALRDYAAVSGDADFARTSWPSARKAFEYCEGADEDGDGLMDNTKAGLAAAETGALRSREILTDVFLAAVWTDAAAAAADLAALAGDEPFVARARAAARRAREAANARFLEDEQGRIAYAVMRDGSAHPETTVWPAVGLWRGVFDRRRRAAAAALDALAGPGIGTDWGTRMLSRDSRLYEPLSYNNGAVWPFLTGYATLALYANGRPDAGWAYVQAGAELAFLEARGYTPELLSGDRLRSLDAAVPHQLFATAGFMSGLMRGLVGLERADLPASGDARAGDGVLHLSPRLPPGWRSLRIRNLRWRDRTLDLALRFLDDHVTIAVSPRAGGPVPLRLSIPLPPGADPPHLEFARDVREPVEATLRYRPGIEIRPRHAPLAAGQRSERLRILETRVEGGTYRAIFEGRRGVRYLVDLLLPFQLASLEGARDVTEAERRVLSDACAGCARVLEVEIPAGEGEWGRREVIVRLGRRIS